MIDIKNLINYFAVFCIFSDAMVLPSWSVFEIRMSYFLLIFIFIMMLPKLKNFYINKLFVLLIIAIILFSFLNVVLGNDSIFQLFKQVIGISINALVYYILIKFNNNDVKKLFTIYLKFALVVGLIGIIQEISYMLHFKYASLSFLTHFYDFSYIFPKLHLPASYSSRLFRVNSIMPEPTSFCIAMMPAFFAAIVSFYKKDFLFLSLWKRPVIILSFLISFSTVGYMGILFTVLLFAFSDLKFKKIVILGSFITLLFLCIYNFMPEIRVRIEDSLSVLKGKSKVEDVNLSTFTFFNNLEVTKKVFKVNPIFGNGLGSHEISYNKYIDEGRFRNIWQPLLSKKDANSLFLRLISETGLFGFFVFFGFVIMNFIPKKSCNLNYLWIINNGIFILFLIRLIRQGHYFSEGFYFFFWLYFFTKQEIRRSKI